MRPNRRPAPEQKKKTSSLGTAALIYVPDYAMETSQQINWKQVREKQNNQKAMSTSEAFNWLHLPVGRWSQQSILFANGRCISADQTLEMTCKNSL